MVNDLKVDVKEKNSCVNEHYALHLQTKYIEYIVCLIHCRLQNPFWW